MNYFKSAVAFFFLFFLHGTLIGNGQQGISYNEDVLPMLGAIALQSAQQQNILKMINDKMIIADSSSPNIGNTYVGGSLLEGKYILDCCCGSRMFWFNKNNPAVLFADVRELETDLCDGSKLKIKPDIISDFRKMPFADNTFKMVVFDPPHLNKLAQDTWMAQKYGVLLPTWENDIKEGFKEAMRVLEPFGTLIFKWNEIQVTTNTILNIIDFKPLFGHPTGKHGRTKWMAFMKGVSTQ